MVWKRDTYASIRGQMQPGDVIAFAGKKPVSDMIKAFTGSNVSHVGVVLQWELIGRDPASSKRILVAEATAAGVQFTQLSRFVETYEGELWWLPLSEESRRKWKAEKQEFFKFLLEQEGKPYDYYQALKAGVDSLDALGLTANREDFEKFFCSELVVAALEKAGVLGPINASEVIPVQLCQFKLYKEKYVQFKGDDDIKIHGFNSMDLSRWED